MLRKIYYWLSPDLRRKARRLVYLPVDVLAGVAGRRQKLVPPTGMIFTGRGDFVRTGDEFLNRFIESAGLQPHHQVLDIGCGIGRMARPLAGFLNEKGAYEGFDIVEEGVRWCSQKYHDFPNFRFRHLPLRNDLYNLSVSEQASRFTFPYEDNSFNLAISISVFTHMQKSEVNQYLQETARVLKP
ncbi:MAG: methyltransferase domain-containing protein, partial [Bacteroidales bacterium]